MNLIYDYETLSQDKETLPVVCNAMFLYDESRFSLESDHYTFEEVVDSCKVLKYNVAEQVQHFGKVIEPECVDWWKSNVDKETIDWLLKPTNQDLSLSAFEKHFRDFIGNNNIKYTFTRGNTFDPIITENIIKQFNGIMPYPWWTIRDTRSFLEGLLYGTGIRQDFIPPGCEGFKKHDPRHDIAMDLMRMQVACHSVLSQLG